MIAAVAGAGVMAGTALDEPPRFDGSGYAMLGQALLEGRGYRNIDHPDEPDHVLFPPGYPALLAAVWSVTGRSLASAHLASVACTVGAAVVSWAWFRRMYPARVALLLGLALAMNWTWHRAGGRIQSEPLSLLLQQVALLATLAASRGGVGRGVGIGLALGWLGLTRLAGAVVGAAVALELAIRRRWSALAATVAAGGLVGLPWAWRLATSPRTTHLDYFPSRSLPEVVLGNAWFYVLRMPDALSAPLVEVGTVFAPGAYPVAAGFAVVASLVLLLGLVRALRHGRRRLAGLVVASTLGLLLIWPFTEAGRFLIPLVPPLLVIAVEGVAAVVRRIAPASARKIRPRTLAAGVLLAAATPYSLYAALSGRAEAERALQGVVDPAFAWIAESGDRPGPLMTAYPAEAFWQTGRPGVVTPADPSEIAPLIERYGVAYLVATEARFARAQGDPLSRFAEEHPEAVVLRWSNEAGTVRVFEVAPPGGVNPTRSGP